MVGLTLPFLSLPPQPNIPLIVGAAVGSVLGVVLLALLGWYLWRRKKRLAAEAASEGLDAKVQPETAPEPLPQGATASERLTYGLMTAWTATASGVAGFFSLCCYGSAGKRRTHRSAVVPQPAAALAAQPQLASAKEPVAATPQQWRALQRAELPPKTHLYSDLELTGAKSHDPWEAAGVTMDGASSAGLSGSLSGMGAVAPHPHAAMGATTLFVRPLSGRAAAPAAPLPILDMDAQPAYGELEDADVLLRRLHAQQAALRAQTPPLRESLVTPALALDPGSLAAAEFPLAEGHFSPPAPPVDTQPAAAASGAPGYSLVASPSQRLLVPRPSAGGGPSLEPMRSLPCHAPVPSLEPMRSLPRKAPPPLEPVRSVVRGQPAELTYEQSRQPAGPVPPAGDADSVLAMMLERAGLANMEASRADVDVAGGISQDPQALLNKLMAQARQAAAEPHL